MRRRLLVAVAPLLMLLVLAVAIPVAGTVADRHTADLGSDRLGDGSRFTVAALTALAAEDDSSLQRLRAELDAYADLYDSPVWLVDREATVLHGTTGGAPPGSVEDSVQDVLAGQSPTLPARILPWSAATTHVVVPVGRDSQVIAALVIEAPTASVRTAVLREWGLIAALLTVPAALLVLGLWPLSRWLMRPVEDLELSAVAVARGDLDARAATASGPPELRGLGHTFNRMVESVSTTVQRQQEFLADASHQLRNPIASTRLAVENLQPHLEDDPVAEQTYLDAIDDVDRMTAVVEGLLAATRLQTRPAQVSRIDGALGSRERHWRSACDDAGMALVVAVSDAHRCVLEPTGGLAAAVDELVSNAVRLSGGSSVRVEGTSRPEGYRLAVVDDGHGLTADERGRATQRFWRSARVQNVTGTGLGLTILTQVLEDVGGRLVLEETPGGGLTVVLLLPPAEE
ncbi:HAMP domain-containing sensor histidine kinase [Nocardioides hwasunensis]|uniref:histidine kinase n=1 Tax=Nocardioides hwasunensis TaxID=397258 RepID=A0ABR8MES0_9ACTN|nr:HAMP domain-containing sensor histidine kinase [Nocardioides hwasunensis]MBD3914468.1 HAMP domain-containing histidine kinase [Nocardioides hwasunensis]